MHKPPETARRALGKGLGALLSSRAPTSEPPIPPVGPSAEKVLSVPIDQIQPNPVQPRTVFGADKLQELSQSIASNGILQPLIVRHHNGAYQLVAGERRWRAAKLAGLKTVPVIVQNVSDDRLLEITLIENIQREDLNPIETAHAFDRLIRQLNLSHEEVARRTGKDRSTITNLLRLLKLPPDIQELVAEHRLSMGQARAILGLPTEELQRQVAEKTSSQGLSVRQVERLVQRMTETREPRSADAPPLDANVKAAIEEMQQVLGTRVRLVRKSEDRGRIEIEYYSAEDLDRIYGLIIGRSDDGS